MIAKCPCEHCGVNIEFATEEFLSGSAVTCPHCGKEMALYVSPQAKPAPVPEVEQSAQKPTLPTPNPLTKEQIEWRESRRATGSNPLSPAESLKQIRQQTCYKTLRGLIDLVQILFFVAAGLAGLGAFAGFFAGSDAPAGAKFVTVIIGIASAFILIVLAIAGKQAALLLVDIADCQIRLAGDKS
jgi:uncharacterized Zn finger protein (UPF0148 family)